MSNYRIFELWLLAMVCGMGLSIAVAIGTIHGENVGRQILESTFSSSPPTAP